MLIEAPRHGHFSLDRHIDEARVREQAVVATPDGAIDHAVGEGAQGAAGRGRVVAVDERRVPGRSSGRRRQPCIMPQAGAVPCALVNTSRGEEQSHVR